MCAAAADDAAAAPEPSSPKLTPMGRIKSFFAFDKQQLAKLGVDAFLTYGVCSNVNAALLVSFAWGTFSKASGFSPLAAGQWPRFLATYVALYATVGTVLRPLRLAAAMSLTPYYGKVVQFMQARLPFRATRPRLNRTLAVVILSLFVNTTCTCLLIAFGVWFAGFVSGVPAFPPGWVWPF